MFWRILIRWIVTSIAVAAAVIVLQWIDPSWVELRGPSAAIAVIVMAAVLGLINAVIRPILTFLSCGFIVATLGLFILVINAFTLWLAGIISTSLDAGFAIDGFWPAFWGGIIISVVSFVLNLFTPEESETDSASPESRQRLGR